MDKVQTQGAELREGLEFLAAEDQHQVAGFCARAFGHRPHLLVHNIEYAKKQKKPIFCPSIEIVVDKIQTGTKKLIDEGTASIIQQGRDIIGVLSALNSSITKPRLNNIEIKLNYLHTLLSILNAPIVLESTLKTLNINIPTNQDVYSTLVYMIKNNLINIDQLLNLLVENNISSINNTLIFNDSY